MNDSLTWDQEMAADLATTAKRIQRALPRMAPSPNFLRRLEAKLLAAASQPTTTPYAPVRLLTMGAALSLTATTLIWWRIRSSRRAGHGP
ncbi:MAG: hypothetical protein HY664_08295 [Chloroflexi bacterium]|nr:hypothetical protein [Chloroflexota bacterium]